MMIYHFRPGFLQLPIAFSCKSESAESSVTQITNSSQINILSKNELDVSGFHV